jgi:hypothetical protein
MSDVTDTKNPDDLDEAFRLLTSPAAKNTEHEMFKQSEDVWKATDPDSYKQDMEKMCRDMFGDNWKIEYEAMLREEFPEEYEGT